MAKNKVLTKTRGANNEGSIFRRSSDNRWVGSITTGVNENGKQIKKVVYGRTRAEVSKKLLEISGRIRSNSYEMIEGQTFGELMNEWLMVFKKSAVTPRTFEGIVRDYATMEQLICLSNMENINAYLIEQRMKCPHCGRCIGFVQSTDDEKVIVYDTHEPIISQELWDKVKEIEMSVSQGKSQGNQIAHFLDQCIAKIVATKCI